MLKKILFIIAVIAVAFSIFDYRTARVVTQNQEVQPFEIAAGDNLFEIGTHLAQEGFIESQYYFYYYAWKEKLRGEINYGIYDIPPQATLTEVTRLFVEGTAQKEEQAQVKVVFPEGLTVQEMGALVNAAGLPGNDFVSLAQNPSQSLRDTYDFIPRDDGLEGYLFPDTYNFFTQATAEDIINKMLTNFAKRVTQDLRTEIARGDFTLHEIITLASIIEGESRENDERPIVAGVFRNRLESGMALGSDATIDYLTGEAEVKHTLEDLEIDSPYNTYKYPGLPPGPVNAPSLSSIDAAVHPQDTEYLYFLNNATTGETVFARTFDEHIANKALNGL